MNDLLVMFAPFIEKEDTLMANSIPGSQRYSATVGFLAAGQVL
jgi:hypothetical protein